MSRFSQYPAASSTDYTDDVTFLILAPDGTVKQATLEGLNTNYLCGIHCASLTITSAEMLALFTTPKAFGLTVPSGYYVDPISVQVGINYGSAAYATNTTIAIRTSGATAVHGTANILGATLSRIAALPVGSTAATAGQTMFLDGTDLEVYAVAGNPTAGDSDVTVYLTYRLVEI